MSWSRERPWSLLLLCSNLAPRRRGCLQFLLSLHLLQHTVEAREAFVPEAAEAAEPLIDLFQRHRRNVARTPLRLAGARDQAGMLQHLQMLRDRGKAHVEGLRQLQHRGLAEREARQD